MMKRTFGVLGILACALLAACGGGSSGGGYTPQPKQSNPPATTYSAHLRFVGALAGQTAIQSDLRRAQSVALDAGTATPIPIMIAAPIETVSGLGCVANECGVGGVVQVVVNPAPSASPAATTFANTAAHVKIVATPTPQPGATPAPLPSGVIAEANVQNDGTDNVQSSGIASASIGAPVNQQPTTQVYQYMAVGLECTPRDSTYSPGWAWNGSGWVTVFNPSQADLYVTGSGCSGNFAVAGDTGTLHFPGGGTTISSDTPFSSVNASQWTNAQTGIAGSTLTAANPDGSVNAIIVAKTRDGQHIFKVFPNYMAAYGNGLDYAGAAEVSAAGVDGF